MEQSVEAATVELPLKISAKIGCEFYSFLIYTESIIFILPFCDEFFHYTWPTAVSLTNTSGKLIYCNAEVDILGPYDIRRTISWSFVIADVIHL